MLEKLILSLVIIGMGAMESYKYIWQAYKIKRIKSSRGMSRRFLTISVVTRFFTLMCLIYTKQVSIAIVYIIGLYSTIFCLWEAYTYYNKKYHNIFHYILSGFNKLPHYYISNPFKGKKVVIADMDGTLTPSRSEVSPNMIKAIKGLLKYYKFVVLGGGTIELFRKQLLNKLIPKLSEKELKNLYILTCSGTKAYKYHTPNYYDECLTIEKLYEDLLKSRDKKKIITVIKQFRKRFNLPSTYGGSYDDRGTQITLPILGLDAPLEKKKLYDPTKSKRLKYAKWLRKKLPEYEIVVGGTTSIDITKKGYNKAYGIKKLVGLLHYNYKYYVFFGDSLQPGGNDFPARKKVDVVEVKNERETLRYFKRELKRKE